MALEWKQDDGSICVAAGMYTVSHPAGGDRWVAYCMTTLLTTGTLAECLNACQRHADEAAKAQSSPQPTDLQLLESAWAATNTAIDQLVSRSCAHDASNLAALMWSSIRMARTIVAELKEKNK